MHDDVYVRYYEESLELHNRTAERDQKGTRSRTNSVIWLTDVRSEPNSRGETMTYVERPHGFWRVYVYVFKRKKYKA